MEQVGVVALLIGWCAEVLEALLWVVGGGVLLLSVDRDLRVCLVCDL